MTRLTIERLTSLATPEKIGGGSRSRTDRCAAYETAEPPLLHPRGDTLAAAARFELATTRLRDGCSGADLSYAAKRAFSTQQSAISQSETVLPADIPILTILMIG